MNRDRDIRAVARAAIAEWASAAGEMVCQRIDAHKRSGDVEGCEFWSRVRLEIDELDCERSRLSLPGSSTRTDRGNRPLFWKRMKAAIKGFLLRKLQNTLPGR